MGPGAPTRVVACLALALWGCGRLGFDLLAPARVSSDGGPDQGETEPPSTTPLEITLDSAIHCAAQSARTGVGVTLDLPGGDYRVSVLEGVVSFQGGNPCFWDVTFVLAVEGQRDLQWVTAPEPAPVECPSTDGLYRDATGAAAAGAGIAGDFRVPSPSGRVTLFVPDSNCRDNQGQLRLRLERR